MHRQKTLFRESVLAKYHGCLVLMSAKPSIDTGRCPQCGGIIFAEGEGWDSGWTECANDDCDFAVLSAHLKEIAEQFGL